MKFESIKLIYDEYKHYISLFFVVFWAISLCMIFTHIIIFNKSFNYIFMIDMFYRMIYTLICLILISLIIIIRCDKK